MHFKIWLENEVKEIPISELIMTKEEIEAAVSNLSRGYYSQTEGPLEVYWLPVAGRYQLTNGYHRVVEAIMRGEDKVQVKPSKEEATWSPPTQDELFIYDPYEEYKGMERFIEPYLLKKL